MGSNFYHIDPKKAEYFRHSTLLIFDFPAYYLSKSVIDTSNLG